MGTAEATTTALLDRHPGAAPQPGSVSVLNGLSLSSGGSSSDGLSLSLD